MDGVLFQQALEAVFENVELSAFLCALNLTEII
jgi:hypothetical protein